MEYAGHEFRTESSQATLVSDNSKVRCPYLGPRGVVMQAYASIQNIYTHQAWPEGGPNICFFKVSWYTNHGKSAISGNPLVRMDGEENDHLSRFVHPRVVYKYALNMIIPLPVIGMSSSETATRFHSPSGPMIH